MLEDGDAMRTLGLLGGMSWESTLPYYRIRQRARARAARRPAFGEARALQRRFRRDRAAAARRRLGHGGRACSRTPRRRSSAPAPRRSCSARTRCTSVLDAIEPAIGIPVLHIADATARRIRAAGLTQGRAARDAIHDGAGRSTASRLEAQRACGAVAGRAERAEVHRIIYDELCLGTIRETSRATLSRDHGRPRRARRAGDDPRLHGDRPAGRRRTIRACRCSTRRASTPKTRSTGHSRTEARRS